jgi:hypothetical protein
VPHFRSFSDSKDRSQRTTRSHASGKNTTPDISTRDFREPIIPLFQNRYRKFRTTRLDAVFPCWGWIARDFTPSRGARANLERKFFTDGPRRELACPVRREMSGATPRKTPEQNNGTTRLLPR